MAMALPPTEPITDTGLPGKKIPRNPTPLSAPQEQQVRDLYYKNVREKCADEIKDFAACAMGRTITMVFKCRPQKLAMNNCMLKYQGHEEMDKARAEWFRLAGERKRQREEEERRLQENRKLKREWWGDFEKRDGQ
ncbi:cytochrome c oxidase biogenesis protein Cmc1 like-domain-containing protein [Lophiotrema nucula]|uniref:COX assembly mitochondrial protein n=1 Tax=Lophiotrema nucula TaxID=690887 RepID=A0A6A5YKD4_9PLEO|nr:cytochrome c oxidase biogenesis protein Cmc1 like-domain-containing protein [Lophiotrema nucula]